MPGERPTYSRATVTITYVENGTAVGPNRPKLRYSFLAQAWCSVLTVFLVWAQVGDVNGMLVSRRFLCISQAPLRSPLFTPVLQWQSRGKMVYLTGVSEYKHGTPSMLAVYPCVTVAIQG